MGGSGEGGPLRHGIGRAARGVDARSDLDRGKQKEEWGKWGGWLGFSPSGVDKGEGVGCGWAGLAAL